MIISARSPGVAHRRQAARMKTLVASLAAFLLVVAAQSATAQPKDCLPLTPTGTQGGALLPRALMNVRFAPSGRGLLDGPPEQWVEQLAGLTLDHGITAFLIGGDDHQTAERFAAEVAPAVRDLVQRERGAARTHT